MKVDEVEISTSSQSPGMKTSLLIVTMN